MGIILMRLRNKVAIITGGNSGIGQAAALRFAAEGAAVVIAARDVERADQTVAHIQQNGGTAHFIPLDIRQPDQCQQVVTETITRFGRLNILVNNAGIILRNRDVQNTTIDEWDETFDVNVKGAYLMSKYALPHLIASHGNIINVSSYLGMVGTPGLAAYCAAKGALVQLTRAMALDHAPDGVRVNCLCPGSVATPMIARAWDSFGEGAEQLWRAKHPVGRIGLPEELASAMLFLASDEASFITGAILPVDGGITAG